jgi:formate dehydrogenase maturation protein FdhE
VPRNGKRWENRIERARDLAARYPFATEILTFYSKLTAFQQGLYSRLESSFGGTPAGARNDHFPPELSPRELEALVPQFKPYLSFLVREGTPVLAGFARSLEMSARSDWAELLTQHWQRSEPEIIEPGGGHEVPGEPAWPENRADSAPVDSRLRGNDDDQTLSRFTALAFLQPYAECLAERAALPPPVVRRSVCPFCGSKPLAGVLRPEGDGAKRSLVCSFCHTEWDYLRIACPACEERDEKKLSVYSTPAFDCVRVEACEICKTYIKTVDLTKNGLAVPEVDELAAIPLTLWAEEHGYAKVCPNTLGV